MQKTIESDGHPFTELFDVQEGESTAQALARKRREAEARGARVVSQRKVGRNDPCPCGSRIKFKKCCLGQEWRKKDQL